MWRVVHGVLCLLFVVCVLFVCLCLCVCVWYLYGVVWL